MDKKKNYFRNFLPMLEKEGADLPLHGHRWD